MKLAFLLYSLRQESHMNLDARIQAHSVTFKKGFIHAPATAPVQPLLSPKEFKNPYSSLSSDHWMSDQTISVSQRLDKAE
jgi:hypothetical protein